MNVMDIQKGLLQSLMDLL
ncbi:hypothetical protein RDABS01_020689 [Bienertia sinuspersici]